MIGSPAAIKALPGGDGDVVTGLKDTLAARIYGTRQAVKR
jgi:hypothetical protein